MLKQTITYTDFDDNETKETLYFNLTKTELTDNLELKDEVEEIKGFMEGEPRQLETHEIKQLVELVKTFMRLSYGIRSADGKRFIKTEELWTEFTQTAAYDAFLYSLFEYPDRAFAFLTGILPKDLRAVVDQVSKAEDPEKEIQSLIEAGQKHDPEAEVPLYQKEQRKPTTDEMVQMDPDEFAAARVWMTENNL